MRDELLAPVMREIETVGATDDSSGLMRAAAVQAAARLESWLVENDYRDRAVCLVLGWTYWYRSGATPEDEREPLVRRALELLVTCYEDGVEPLPEPLLPYLANGAEQVAVGELLRVLDVDDPGLLEHMVALWKRIVRDTAPDHPHRAFRLSNLGGALRLRVMRGTEAHDPDDADDHGDPRDGDLDTAVDVMAELFRLRDGTPTAGDHFNLGQLLVTRFHHRHNGDDLDEAIANFRKAVQLSSANPTYLALLGRGLWERSELASDPSDLSDALDCLHTADRLAEPDHSARGLIHSGLGAALRTRAVWTNDTADLDEAVRQFDLALDLTPEGHPDRPPYASRRAEAKEQQEQYQETLHLQEDVLREMVRRIPPTPGPVSGQDKDPVDVLGSMGALCRRRAIMGPQGAEWDRLAISYYEAALASAAPGHPLRAQLLTLLGTALSARGGHGTTGGAPGGGSAGPV